MTSSQPMKRVATLCRDFPISKILSSADYGADANIFTPRNIADMELSTPQCLLLALLHSLVEGDISSCILLADICHKVEKLRLRHYRAWLLEEFVFPRTDLENAMALLVQLVADDILKLPGHVMTTMTALANQYGISGVHLRTLTEEGRCDLAIQLENAVINNSPRVIFELANEGADVCGLTESGDSLLHLAARAGSSASIAALSILNADLEVVNPSNATPLEEAVRHNSASSVKALLMSGAKFDKRFIGGDTYLHIAAAGVHNEALEALLQREMNLNENNHLGETPLVQAVKACNVRGIELLLEKGADFSALSGVRLKDGDSLVHFVARSGNVEILKLLEDRKIPANIKNQNGLTPLHVACNPTVVETILRMGVVVDTQDNTGKTPLMIAARNAKEDIISLLLLNKADPKIKDNEGRTALHYAAERDSTKLVNSLLVAGARVNDKDNNGEIPAFVAAANNNVEILQLLVENGADLSQRNRYDYGILDRAAGIGHVEVVKALLNARKAVDITERKQWTALHRAAEKGHVAVVTVLLDAGTPVDHKDGYQMTALHYAAQGGHVAVVNALLGAGAVVNIKVEYEEIPLKTFGALGLAAAFTTVICAPLAIPALLAGGMMVRDMMTYRKYTALHFAAREGHTTVVTVLLDHGADQAAKALMGGTPLMVASSFGRLAVVQLLVDRGTAVNVQDVQAAICMAKNHRAIADYLSSRGSVQ